ncbi:recombinase family protein [Proteobacteria bacterium 005FR1]|nr:recombinase family protein [Proteobacteria bacterium 005FR1]
MELAAYIRVSTDKQAAENDSLDGQRRKILRWCEQRGHTVVKYYVEAGQSAFEGRRPNFERLINDATSSDRSFDGIVVYNYSRFSRKMVIQLTAQEALLKSGIALFSCSEEVPDDPALAGFMTTIIGAMNEMQSQQNSRTVIDRLNDTASKGYFTGAPPPFGYHSIVDPKTEGGPRKKVLVIKAEEAEVVRYAFDLAYRGTSGFPYGVKKIATVLNEKGITRRGRMWNCSHVHRLLTDTSYIGERVFGKNRKRPDPYQGPIIVPVPAIISRDVFEHIQRSLKSRAPSSTTAKGLRSPSILTGLLKCGTCGCNMVVNTGKSGRYEYYKCSHKIKKTVRICECPTIRKDQLESRILQTIAQQVLTKAYI